jgi:transcriptional regulator with XRE-family HTH domain
MNQLRTARQSRGWTQARAAARLGVSQPYLAMLEAGQRPLTSAVARRAMRVYGLPPTVLSPGVAPRVSAATLAQDLAALGYPGFAHLARRGGAAKHPGAVLLTALAQPELEARAVEALPWLLLRYWSLDPAWLVREAKVRDLQNRLGFVVSRRPLRGRATLARDAPLGRRAPLESPDRLDGRGAAPSRLSRGLRGASS